MTGVLTMTDGLTETGVLTETRVLGTTDGLTMTGVLTMTGRSLSARRPLSSSAPVPPQHGVLESQSTGDHRRSSRLWRAGESESLALESREGPRIEGAPSLPNPRA